MMKKQISRFNNLIAAIATGDKIISKDEAYKRGYDSEMNGANDFNCHYSIFLNKESMLSWQCGVKAAKEDRKFIHETFDDMIEVYYDGQ